MRDEPALRPATPDELIQTIAYGLQFNERGKSHRHAGGYMAQIAAEVLARHLEQSGFVVMERPPACATYVPDAWAASVGGRS